MEQKDFVTEQLTTFTPENAEAIRNLTQQIGNNYQLLTDEELKELLSSRNTKIIIAKDADKIIGMITVTLIRIPYRKKAFLDDVVVDKAYRGHGLGTKLFEKALDIAREEKVAYAEFTSAPHRTAANSLYQKLGFEKKDTNVYRVTFANE
jgi:ribosomal protein S18 acetylase RimI-like enzyme